MHTGPFYLITCEHAGNRIPSRYAGFFRNAAPELRSHTAYDAGALSMARELALALGAPLVVSAISRLLVDLNRSVGRHDLYSDYTRHLAPELREEILRRYYVPYRTKVETLVTQAHAADRHVLHVSCHSFTPVLDGKTREADIGLLHDPARPAEAMLCERWRATLLRRLPHLQVRMNEPYLGTADGLTTTLRAHFPERYAGIELEVNQKLVHRGAGQWRALRQAIAASLGESVRCD